MPIIFKIAGVEGWYTTDPEIFLNIAHIEGGAFIRLPNGRIYQLVSVLPPEFREVPLEKVQSVGNILNAQRYSIIG